MKTLEEVITVLDGCFLKSRKEWCIENCPYLKNDEQMCRRDVLNDALHYLKTYRANQRTYEENSRKAEEARERYIEAVKNCELAENKYRKLTEETSQKLRNTSQITCPKCHSEFVILPEANNALTWSELKQMEGKPVFLEQYWYPMEDETGITEDEVETDKYWAVIDNAQDKRIHFVGKRLNMGMTKSDLNPNKNGGWQAYRKER